LGVAFDPLAGGELSGGMLLGDPLVAPAFAGGGVLVAHRV
jgi:hypothetical protein